MQRPLQETRDNVLSELRGCSSRQLLGVLGIAGYAQILVVEDARDLSATGDRGQGEATGQRHKWALGVRDAWGAGEQSTWAVGEDADRWGTGGKGKQQVSVINGRWR